MPVLIYYDNQGQRQEQQFLDTLRIGSDPEKNDLVLPGAAGILPTHAIIMRSVVNRLHMLVNLADEQTRVNRRRVVSFQVLRQRDELQLGQVHLKLWELRLARIQEERFVGRECLICTIPFKAGDEVFFCPRCTTPYHRDCWFSVHNCANYTCEYPVHARVMDALSSWVTFEQYEGKVRDRVEIRGNSTVIIRNSEVTCQANNRGDQVALQAGDQIAYCPSPSCRAPFHLECWLALPKCTRCSYDIRGLIDQVFSSNDERERQPGGFYAG